MSGAYGNIEKSAVLTEYYTAKQLKEDLKQRDQVWKQKFSVTHELREGQAQHKEATEQSIKEVHARIDTLVRDLVPRAEVEKRMTTLVKEVQGCMDTTFKCQQALKELTTRVKEHELESAQTFATKLETEALEKRQALALKESRTDAQVAIDSVRQDSAPATKVGSGFSAASERSAALEQATADLRRDLTQLDRSLESLQHRTEDRFAKKLGLKELEASLMIELKRRDDSHATKIDGVRSSHASKQHVDDRMADCYRSLEAMRESLSKVSKEVDEKTTMISELDTLCKETLAPRSELKALVKEVEQDALSNRHIGDEIKMLSSEVDCDRERLMAISRSMQAARSDVNQISVEIQEFRELRDEYHRNKQYTADLQETLEHREREHFREIRADQLLQKQVVERLDQTIVEIKAEFKSLWDKQEKDTQGLREQSTQRYMEAMDHAIGLTQTVNKMQDKAKKTGGGDAAMSLHTPAAVAT